MATTKAIPGTSNICRETVSGDGIRRHLLQCIPDRTGLRPMQNTRRRDGRWIDRKTAYISVRSQEQPSGWSWECAATT